MGKEFEKDDFFKIDPEPHLIGDMELINHFPGVQMWWRAIEAIHRPFMTGMPPEASEGLEEWELIKTADPDSLLRAMDKYGVDIACLLPESMMDTTGYTSRWCTNGEMAKIVESNPERFMYQPNISPIRHKGVKNTIWEMEYWVKEKGAKIFKFYPPEDTYINDPDKSKYALPIQLDDVARDFPDLRINAFHMGYPYCDDLNMIAMGHPNVYVCLSLLVPWALSAPRRFAKIIGEALRWVGPDKIIWGCDYAGFGVQVRGAVQGLREFQIPEDMQEGYGYPAITDDDRRKIFGENLGRLLGIDTSKRRINVGWHNQ